MDLLEAARQLLEKRPDVRFIFVGDGPLRPDLERQSRTWNIADRVSMAGEIHHNAVPEYMIRADVLCLPSHREGYPNVVLEALACGLPVVATNVGGVPEIINDTQPRYPGAKWSTRRTCTSPRYGPGNPMGPSTLAAGGSRTIVD